jgi:hypothetical protein
VTDGLSIVAVGIKDKGGAVVRLIARSQDDTFGDVDSVLDIDAVTPI